MWTIRSIAICHAGDGDPLVVEAEINAHRRANKKRMFSNTGFDRSKHGYLTQSAPVPSKTIDEHVIDVSDNLASAVKHLPAIFLDGFYIETEHDLKDGASPIDSILLPCAKMELRSFL